MIYLANAQDVPRAQWECHLCGVVTTGTIHIGPPQNFHESGEERCYGEISRTIVTPESRPPLTRDLLLSEITRSLRATMPDRAEEYVKELERRSRSYRRRCP